MKTLQPIFTVVIALLVTALPSFGQAGKPAAANESALTVKVTEKENGKPVLMATVYIVPVGDTVATAFTFSDKKGIASFSSFPAGKYTVNVQLLGFKPYKQDLLFEARRHINLSVELEEDAQLLDGASITAMGDLVTVKGDTLIYNATSFRTASNANLGDLLKKMPGIEVDKGRVKVNGEPVKRITVEGKTFFFGDQSKALENLPAFIVDKVKVIDKERRDRFGLAGKEKEMDIRLKDEYRNAWFGNVSAEGGASIKDKTSDWFDEPARALYNAKLYASYYGDNDQLTVLGGGNNVNTNQLSRQASGLSDVASCGVNYNTSRIPGFDTAASSSYDYNNNINRSESERTSFLASGEQLVTRRRQDSNGINHTMKGNFSFGNLPNEPWLEGFLIGASFRYDKKKLDDEGFSSTRRKEEALNSSESRKNGDMNDLTAGLSYRGRYFYGEKAKLSFDGHLDYFGSRGNTTETSLTRFRNATDRQSLFFDDKADGMDFESHLSYSLTFSRKWEIIAGGLIHYDYRKDNRDAQNTSDYSRNEYYSKYATDKNLNLKERLVARYSIGLGKTKSLLSIFGLCIYEDRITHHSRAFGAREISSDRWHVNVGPEFTISVKDGPGTSYGLISSGKSNVPSGGPDSSPVLDISDPTNLSTGNIYLKSGYHQDLRFTLRLGREKLKGATLNMRLLGAVDYNDITRASWFDDSSIRYSIPVNAKKPRYSTSLDMTYVRPLNKHKSLNLTVTPKVMFNAATSYIAKGTLPGLDRDHFDYAQTMRWFYGDSDGSEFYSGRSGFMENRTTQLNWSLKADLKYEILAYSLRGGALVGNTRNEYSASPSVKVNNWRFSTYAEVLWQNKAGWEAETRFDFNGYSGFGEEFNRPEYLLNLKLAKAVGSFTVSLSAYDILGCTKSFSHIASAEYVEDRYRNTLGRCILLGLSYRFGKWDLPSKNSLKIREQQQNL